MVATITVRTNRDVFDQVAEDEDNDSATVSLVVKQQQTRTKILGSLLCVIGKKLNCPANASTKDLSSNNTNFVSISSFDDISLTKKCVHFASNAIVIPSKVLKLDEIKQYMWISSQDIKKMKRYNITKCSKNLKNSQYRDAIELVRSICINNKNNNPYKVVDLDDEEVSLPNQNKHYKVVDLDNDEEVVSFMKNDSNVIDTLYEAATILFIKDDIRGLEKMILNNHILSGYRPLPVDVHRNNVLRTQRNLIRNKTLTNEDSSLILAQNCITIGATLWARTIAKKDAEFVNVNNNYEDEESSIMTVEV